ncbi:hypothetical protein C8R46DRAFT_1357360 [Mycena filopes]|nr:hypothetical protein C8R46DRAFT_1357360 [Mycena filopes]
MPSASMSAGLSALRTAYASVRMFRSQFRDCRSTFTNHLGGRWLSHEKTAQTASEDCPTPRRSTFYHRRDLRGLHARHVDAPKAPYLAISRSKGY